MEELTELKPYRKPKQQVINSNHPHYELMVNYQKLVQSDEEMPLIWLTSYCLYDSPFLEQPKLLCHYQIVLAELLILLDHNPTKLLEIDFDVKRDWFDKLSESVQTKILSNRGTPEIAYMHLPSLMQKAHLYQFAKKLLIVYLALKAKKELRKLKRHLEK